MPPQSEDQSEEQTCRWCGYLHEKLCPFVKAYEFDQLGNVTRVEFRAVETKEAPKEEEKDPPQPDYPRLGEAKNA